MPGRNLRSYLVRLRNASLPEVAFRVRQALLVRRLRGQFQSAHFVLSVPNVDRSVLAGLTLPDLFASADHVHAKSILEGKTFTLNGDTQNIARFEEMCRGRFFSDIPLPDALDIRQVWEPARLQHITILLLALAQATDGDDSDRIKDFAKDALLKWVEKNPFLAGPHYLSAMECGLRIPVFFYGLKLLSDLSDDEANRILRAIYEHAWWVSRRLSLYTSLGNHTVCECVGLIFAGAVFRDVPEGKKWLGKGAALLRQELSHQILDDGGPAEQSLAYHRFVIALYWLAVNFLEKNGFAICADWRPRLELGEQFLAAFRVESGTMPAIGDSDGGCAIGPGLPPARGVAENLPAGVHNFPASGYTVVRFGKDAVLTFDHGSLGMMPLYNHGHADALSVTLAVKGKPVFVDPGTYRYNGVPEWRMYFKGTRAHNTVTIDGEDQAVQETGFIWSRPFKAELTRNEKTGERHVLEARHDGYGHLKDAVTHIRKVSLENSHIIVSDRFEGEGVHEFELNYHLHPETLTQRQDGLWRMQNGDAIVFIRMLKGYDLMWVEGQEDPLLGWYSPAYGVKERSAVLCCRKRGSASEVSFLTAISLGEMLSPDAYLERAAAL